MNEFDPQAKHRKLQSKYFNDKVKIFNRAIPGEIVERTKRIVDLSLNNTTDKILDVGTGTGVLIEHFLAFGILAQNILGLDLTLSMLVQAEQNYPQVNFCHSDFLDFTKQSRFYLNNELSHFNYDVFDIIFFNACFGNIFNQDAAIAKACILMNPGGKIVISHPMGAQFVQKLHVFEPHIVPYPLPDLPVLNYFCQTYNLKLDLFEDESDFYLAILIKL